MKWTCLLILGLCGCGREPDYVTVRLASYTNVFSITNHQQVILYFDNGVATNQLIIRNERNQ